MSKEKISGIYCIENIVNHKKYIGQSCNIYSRWYNHKYCLNNNIHSNTYLQNSWNKYGKNNFVFTIIEKCDENIIDEKEKYWINHYNTMNDDFGYNLDSGGNLNKHHSIETKIKMSRSAKGIYPSEETKIKISNNRKGKMVGQDHFMYGKHLSLSTKSKISKSLKGLHAGNKNWCAKKVICLTTSKIFTTLKEAGEYYKTNPVDISKCCNEKRKSSGKLEDGTPLQWSFYNRNGQYDLKEYKIDKNTKSVSQFDLNMNYIATYESAREAERQTGIGYKMISRVCRGERPHTHGYIFKFVEAS